MVRQFSGKSYELDVSSQENMEELLDANDITDPVMRDAALNMKSTQTLTLEGDQWTEVVQTGEHKSTITFKLDEEFDEKSPDGNISIRSVVTLKGDDTLFHLQNLSNGRVVTFEKKYSDDKMVMTITAGGVTAKRTYKAVSS